MATKIVTASPATPQPPATIEAEIPDIVNEFLTMNGRIMYHDTVGGEVITRRFTGPNTFVEEGWWYGDIFDNNDTRNFRIPYKLTAVLGKPIDMEQLEEKEKEKEKE